MNFSEPFRTSIQLCGFSPNGRYVAVVNQFRVVVRDKSSLQITANYNCVDSIQYIEWSPDSQFILCGLYKRQVVQVWSLEDPDWTCKIEEGAAGMLSATWSPDSRHVLTMAQFQLRITVWSLVNKSVSYIKYPKDANPGFSFTSDGNYLAVAEKRECRDCVSIFACSSTWHLVKHFETDTQDLAGLSWSPGDMWLCVWDSPLRYKVLLYSSVGDCIASYSAYDWELGIRCVSWSPSGQFIAIGSYDQKVRLLNHLTWQTIVTHSHTSQVKDADCCIFKEVEEELRGFQLDLALADGLPLSAQSTYETVEIRPVDVVSNRPDPNKPNPRMGVTSAVFSPDSRYLATRNANMATTVWIWDMMSLKLKALLIHKLPVKCIVWVPTHCRLAVCTGSNHVYFWTPLGCVSVRVSSVPNFAVTSLQWDPAGECLALISSDSVILGFLTPS